MTEENYANNDAPPAETEPETPTAVATEPEPEPEPVAADGAQDPGLQKLRQAINLIKTHSAANVAGSMLNDVLILLEESYGILGA